MFTFGSLARNTLWTIFGQGIRILVQVAYFVLIARILRQDGYGAFSGVVALVAILAPFAGWGSGSLLIKNVAQDAKNFPMYWGRALIITCVSATVLTGLALLLAWWILPASVSLFVLLWVAISDLLFARLLETAGQSFQAMHQLAKTASLWVLLSVGRLAAVLLLTRMHSADDLLTWSVLYMTSTAVVSVGGCIWVSLQHGRPEWDMSRWKREFGEGFFFASSVSAQRIYMESDKALLTRLSSLEAAGIYAAASRVLDVAFVPVNALLAAAYARFFIQGLKGVRGTLELSRRLLPFALGYSLLVGIGLYLLAPAIPLLLGQGFADTVAAVRWLAVVPVLMSVHRFAADSLTGAGKQMTRTHIESLAAVLNVVINICLVPVYSWKGAAWATILTELMLAITLGTALWSIAARGARTPSV